jgi:hypothetical protein
MLNDLARERPVGTLEGFSKDLRDRCHIHIDREDPPARLQSGVQETEAMECHHPRWGT